MKRADMLVAPPAGARKPHEITIWSQTRTDNYAWMRDDNWRNVLRDPSLLRADIKQHLEAENAYSGAIMAPTDALQEKLFSEMKGRIKPDDASAPSPDGPWEYYTRYAPGAEHAIYARRPRGRADGEEILIDAD